MASKADARKLYESDLAAGYSREQARARLQHLSETDIALPDPTAKYWPALIHQESGGNQGAVSSAGATGVAQVMPATGPEAAALAGLEWDPAAFKEDPVYNAKLGRAYFRKQMADNGNDPVKALAAYNAGPGALRKAGGDLSKLPAETQNYVPSIMNRAEQGMQQDMDSPEAAAQAQDALMSTKDRARKAYNDVLANGGTREQAKAAIAQFAVQPQPQQAPTAQTGASGSWEGGEPTFAQKLQSDIEKVHETDPITAGMGRSFAGVIQGTRKLYNQATGDDAKVAELNADEKRARDYWEKVDPKGSGFSQGDLGRVAGDVATFAGAPMAKAEKVGTAGKLLYDTLLGGAQGAVQPTTSGESQAVNAGVGAGVGGALSSAGSTLRSLIGTPDAGRAASAATLRGQGVDVPAGQEYNSPLSTMLRKAGGSEGSRASSDKSLTEALAKTLGIPGQDITNSSLEANSRRLGPLIGDAHKGFDAAPDRDFFKNILEIGRKYQLSGPNTQGDEVGSMIDHLLNLAKPGNKISGEEYQALRSGLSGDSITGNAAQKIANGDMKRALDKLFNDQNPRPELPGLRSEYRLSQILRAGSGVPAEGVTAKSLRNRVEGAARKGSVNADARSLINETAGIMPSAKLGGDAVLGAGDDSLRSLERPSMMGVLSAILRAGSAPISKGYDKGLIQGATNNEPTRKALANLLRGMIIPPATPKGEQ